jgi:hypothetical protein
MHIWCIKIANIFVLHNTLYNLSIVADYYAYNEVYKNQ